MDFLFHGAQEALVGAALFAGHGVADLAVVEHGFDFIEVLAQQVLRFLLERHEQGLVHVGLDPAVIEILAREHQIIDPLTLAPRFDARIAFDAILQGQQHIHGGEAVALGGNDGVRQGIDDETGRYARQALVGRLVARAQAADVGMLQVVDVFVCIHAQLLDQFGFLVLAFGQAAEDGEHGRRMQHVRIEMHVAEGGRGRQDQLAVNARLFAVIECVRHLHDDHAVEQRLVFAFLQEFAKFGQIRVRENGFVEVNQGKARHLDILFLR